MFHVSLLKIYLRNGHTQPLHFWVDGEDFIEVERLVSHRVRMITTQHASLD